MLYIEPKFEETFIFTYLMSWLMPIQCRTGCLEQVNYEEIEFPDGFAYLLPRNIDGAIHDCKNLQITDYDSWSPEESKMMDMIIPLGRESKNKKKIDEILETTPNMYHSQYFDRLLQISHNRIFENDELPKDKRMPEGEMTKIMLLNVQMRCNLFPTPFVLDPTGYGHSYLIDLAEKYEWLKEYESAIIAILIQDKITHDQGEKLIQLERLKNKIPIKEIKNENTVIEIRDKYIRNLEGKIKEFLRKNYPVKTFRESESELFLQLNEHREKRDKRRTNTIGEFDDVYERLTLGQCRTIIIKHRKKMKKSEGFNIFTRIESESLNRMEWIVENFRNENDHAVEDVEREFTEDDKTLAIIYTNSITDHLEKLAYI